MYFENRKHLLWCLTGLLCLLGTLVVWNLVKYRRDYFAAGTRPNLEAEIPAPTLPTSRNDDPVRGAPSSSSTIRITFFSDITCLSCRLQEQELNTLVQDYPDRIQWVWRDAPQPAERPDSIIAASALRCAKDQKRFWELHDALIQLPLLNYATIKATAQRLPINQNRFDDCLQNGTHIQAIANDTALAAKHHIDTVPTIFVGNTPFVGITTAAQLRWTIQKQLLFTR